MADETLLTISGDGVPSYSARGITQTLEPIDAAKNLRRTVNGALIDLSASQFKKYRSEITCTDKDAPAFDAVEIGDTVTIGCVEELGYLTSGGSPARPVVSGSSRTVGAWTYYRPELTMVVVGKAQSFDEYGAVESWTLELEES
jgi:hypothetical protein